MRPKPSSTAKRVALIEPHGHIGGGHSTAALPQLASAASRQSRQCFVICLNGIHPDARRAVVQSGATLVENLEGHAVAWSLLLLARALPVWRERLRARGLGFAIPQDLVRLSHSFIEAASLRLARKLVGPPGTTAILTTSETLHALTCKLGRTAHVRVVHAADFREGPLTRLLDRLARAALRHARFVCPTDRVARQLQERLPQAHPRVSPFAMRDKRLYVASSEQAGAKKALGFGDSTVIASLIGGWWRSKDIPTVLDALQQVEHDITAIIAGAPLDEGLIARYHPSPNVRLELIPRVLSAEDLRTVYAASDFTIVSRYPDGIESGTVYDAVQRGTPVICSDHDAPLTARLSGRPWARTFRAGDASDLARVVDQAVVNLPSRPLIDAADAFGLLSPDEQLDLIDCLTQRARQSVG